MAGKLYPAALAPELEVSWEDEEFDERFERPSKRLPIQNKTFDITSNQTRKLIFSDPEPMILAFYGVLEDAANLAGYNGGCGTIGQAKIPYPDAYSFLSSSYQNKQSLADFIASFEGVGHINLLTLLPAYAVDNDKNESGKHTQQNNAKRFMVEIEVITGKQYDSKCPPEDQQISYFAYFYGLVETVKENNEWKISNIEYQPEIYLCAPMHSWFYYADAVIAIVYQQQKHIIDHIDHIEQNDQIIEIFASKRNQKYRFEFVRLTNGYDVLLREFEWQNNKWVEVSLLNKEDQFYKLVMKD